MVSSIFDTVNITTEKRAATPVPFETKIINIWSVRPRSLLIGKTMEELLYHTHPSLIEKFDEEKYNIVFFSTAFNTEKDKSSEDYTRIQHPLYDTVEKAYSFMMVYVHVSKLSNNRVGRELFKSEWVEFYVPLGLNTSIFYKDGEIKAISAIDHLPLDQVKIFIAPEYSAGERRAVVGENGSISFHKNVTADDIECMKTVPKEVVHIPAAWAVDTNDVCFKLRGVTFNKSTGLRSFNGLMYDSFINIAAGSSYLRGAAHERDWYHMVKSVSDITVKKQIKFLDECDGLVSMDSFFRLLTETVKVISGSRILSYTDEEITARYEKNLLGSFAANGYVYEVAKPNWLYDEDEVSATLLMAMHAYVHGTCYFEASQYSDRIQKNLIDRADLFREDMSGCLRRLFRNPVGASHVMRIDAEGNRHIVLPSDWMELKMATNPDFVMKQTKDINTELMESFIRFSAPVAEGVSKIMFDTYTPVIGFSGGMVPYSKIGELKDNMDNGSATEGTFIRMGMLSSIKVMFMNMCGHTRSSTSLVLEVNEFVRENLNSDTYGIIIKEEEETNAVCTFKSQTLGFAPFNRELHRREMTNSCVTRMAIVGRRGVSSVNNAVALVDELKAANLTYPEHLYVKGVSAKASDTVLFEFNHPLKLRGFFLERLSNLLGLPSQTMFEIHEDLVETSIEKLTKVAARIATSGDRNIVIRSLERASPAPNTSNAFLSHPNIGSNMNVCSGEVSNSDLQTFLETLEVINFDSSYNYNLFPSAICPVNYFVRKNSSRTDEEIAELKVKILGMMEDAGVTVDSFHEAVGTVQTDVEQGDDDDMDEIDEEDNWEPDDDGE